MTSIHNPFGSRSFRQGTNVRSTRRSVGDWRATARLFNPCVRFIYGHGGGFPSVCVHFRSPEFGKTSVVEWHALYFGKFLLSNEFLVARECFGVIELLDDSDWLETLLELPVHLFKRVARHRGVDGFYLMRGVKKSNWGIGMNPCWWRGGLSHY